MGKNLIVLGLVIGILGLVFSLLPHYVHMQLLGSGSMEGGHSHTDYATWGLIVAVIGFALALAGWKIF